ncbi:hypothetical protein I3843_01G086300 [Carya illinoinensis]|nr:hypothetical protein I3843_01G086300 [Carya illinoinensis]
MRVPDVEGQNLNKAEVKTSSDQKKETKKRQLPKWIVNILNSEGLFLASCVFSVSVDPLFFYLPVINEERKCVALDTRLCIISQKCVALDTRLCIISLCLRTFLDSISLVNIVLQCFRDPHIHENACDLQGQDGVDTDAGSKAKRYLWSSSFAIDDVLAMLPIPQLVLLPIIFSKTRASESLNNRKLVLSVVVLFQYLPRALRIYLSWKKVFILRSIRTSLSKNAIAVKAGFNMLLFIVASHILGGFWYFLSVERETACWHLACENHIECDRSSLDCDHGFGNYTFLNDYCPIETTNTTVFDFGMFQGALQSGTVASMDFPRKILYCFWWGLRNLSSFGSNLQTSPHIWENCFAVLTSISGLLLFMYFLGRLQMYMQWEASRQLDEAKKLEEYNKWRQYEMKAKKGKIHEWIDRNPRLKEKEKLIISEVNRMFAENKDIDAENPLRHLPMFTRRKILSHLCLPLLQTVPLLRNESEDALKLISCDFLKQVYYNENSYIVREGEPLDALLFITRGIIWTYTTSPAHRQTGCLKTDDFVESPPMCCP